jgi:signal transduction histidine kinase
MVHMKVHMKADAVRSLDLERALGRALIDLLAHLPEGPGSDDNGGEGDSIASVLAGHALVGSVTGCAVCVIDSDEMIRVAGVAGATGTVEAGSLWRLAASPVAEVLAGAAVMEPISGSAHGPLARALAVPDGGQLVATPLRLGAGDDCEPTSVGALLLVRDRTVPLDVDERDFLVHHASLVTISMLGAAPAQDWAGRARRLRGNVDAALDVVGSLDEGELIHRILQRTCQTLQASRATLLRVDGDSVIVEGVHDADGRAVVPGWRGPISGQPLIVEAMRSGHVVVGDNIMRDELPEPLRDAFADVQHAIVLPIRVRGDDSGLLVVGRRQPRPFIHDDAFTLQLLGHVALLAVRNARLYGDAQAASRTMSSFLNLVVHDLRAPLTVLSGYIDLLRDGTFGEAPQEWRRPMELITAKLTETHRLVDDILLAARLESGAVPPTIERLDLNEVVARAATRSEARAGLAGAAIETAPHPGAVTAYGDIFHVDRIVDNLVNNAITYGGSAPWVRLSVDPSTPPAIRVEDRGLGISPALHERIFERFFRVNHRLPGTGFGLHVGRALAESCAGTLTLEWSALGEGSTFRLELPTKESPR